MNTPVLLLSDSAAQRTEIAIQNISKAELANRTTLYTTADITDCKLFDKVVRLSGENVEENIDSILSENERLIIISEQVDVSAFILRYMNSALDFYDKRGVMGICGYADNIDMPLDYQFSTYMSYRPNLLSYGTWRNMWQKRLKNIEMSKEILRNKSKRTTLTECGNDLYYKILNRKDVGLVERLALSSAGRNSPFVYPRKSLVRIPNGNGYNEPVAANISLSHFCTSLATNIDITEQIAEKHNASIGDRIRSFRSRFVG